MDYKIIDTERVARFLIQQRYGLSVKPMTLTEAYEVQDWLIKILAEDQGWHRVGYKLGATTPEMRKMMGLQQPFHGPLFDHLTLPSPATVKFRPGFHRTYEVEYALRLGTDLTRANPPYSAEDIIQATEAVLPAIELTGSLSTPHGSQDTPRLIADLAGHADEILGVAVTDFRNLELINTPVTLTVNGTVVATGNGAHVDGSPFLACAGFATELAKLGSPLRAGDIISTGSTIKPYPVQAGQVAVADFGPLGRVKLDLT